MFLRLPDLLGSIQLFKAEFWPTNRPSATARRSEISLTQRVYPLTSRPTRGARPIPHESILTLVRITPSTAYIPLTTKTISVPMSTEQMDSAQLRIQSSLRQTISWRWPIVIQREDHLRTKCAVGSFSVHRFLTVPAPNQHSS